MAMSKLIPGGLHIPLMKCRYRLHWIFAGRGTQGFRKYFMEYRNIFLIADRLKVAQVVSYDVVSLLLPKEPGLAYGLIYTHFGSSLMTFVFKKQILCHLVLFHLLSFGKPGNTGKISFVEAYRGIGVFSPSMRSLSGPLDDRFQTLSPLAKKGGEEKIALKEGYFLPICPALLLLRISCSWNK